MYIMNKNRYRRKEKINLFVMAQYFRAAMSCYSLSYAKTPYIRRAQANACGNQSGARRKSNSAGVRLAPGS